MQQIQKGFTLLELLLVVMILGVLSGLATYSSRMILDGNTTAQGNQFVTAVRNVKSRTMVSARENWHLEVGYKDGNYYWKILKGIEEGITEIEFCKIPRDIKIVKFENIDGIEQWVDINTTIAIKIKFNPVTGQPNLEGAGQYKFVNTVTHKETTVYIVESTGGILIDD